MEIVEELARIKPEREMALTIGVFDGVHLGHQWLITKLKEKANKLGLLNGIITFDRHPETILAPGNALPYLTSLEERLSLLKGLGVDHLIVLSFTEKLAKLEARNFIELLKRYLKLRLLVVGPDFALGKGREGNVAFLRSLGKELDFEVEVVPPLKLENETVSSTLIRKALAQGDMERVARMLGRNFKLSGEVVHGESRGGSLFPTANLKIADNHALPADGVYATQAYFNNIKYEAVTNIGVRPTFGPGKRTVETHLLDFSGDLYQSKLTIEFAVRLRDEIRFDTPEKLKAQIEKDIEQAREILKEGK